MNPNNPLDRHSGKGRNDETRVAIVRCNKHVLSVVEGRSALHHNVRRNARWLLRPTAAALLFLGLIAATFANAKELGRLFFTPEQRAQLDYNFARESRPDNNDRGGVILNGIVQKHGGKRTAWINGVPQTAGNSDEKAPESMPVTLPGQTKPIKVKVGQRVLLEPSANPDIPKPNSSKPDAAKQDASDDD